MKYTIAYQYMMAGKIEVEASSLEEAKELAYESSAFNEDNEFFLEETFEINEEMTNEYNRGCSSMVRAGDS